MTVRDNMDWFEDDAFWQVFGDCMFTEQQFEDAAAQWPDWLALLETRPERILDLGSGPGRFALVMAEQGATVTALDISPSLISQGRQRAEDRGLEIEWLQQDMRLHQRPAHYDLITSLWTSFGYFDARDDDQRLLAQCLLNLRPGGQLLIDTTGREYVCRHIQPVHLTEYDDGRLLIERPMLTDGMRRYENEWLLIDGDRVDRAYWHHNLYTADQLVDRVEQAGFIDCRVYGSATGDAYDLDAERLIVVARRPA